jgi:hypothetical protein
MAVLVDQAVSERLHYSLLSDTPDCVFYVDEVQLVQKIAELRQHRKEPVPLGQEKRVRKLGTTSTMRGHSG